MSRHIKVLLLQGHHLEYADTLQVFHGVHDTYLATHSGHGRSYPENYMYDTFLATHSGHRRSYPENYMYDTYLATHSGHGRSYPENYSLLATQLYWRLLGMIPGTVGPTGVSLVYSRIVSYLFRL